MYGPFETKYLDVGPLFLYWKLLLEMPNIEWARNRQRAMIPALEIRENSIPSGAVP